MKKNKEFDIDTELKKAEISEEIIEDSDEREVFDEVDDESYNTSLQIGGAIHKQSEILKRFPQLAKEVKYSFFNEMDKKHFSLRSRTYQDLMYMKTIFNLSYFENLAMQSLRCSLYKIKTKDELKIYLHATNQSYLWFNIKHLNKTDFDLILIQLKEISDDDLISSIYSQSNFVENVYEKLSNGEFSIDEVDEMGLINDIYTITESSKAKGGNERKSMNTTISVTSEHNERHEQAEGGENPLMNKVKSFVYGKPKPPVEEQE